LQEHIDAFIAAYNDTAEPFAWTKKKVHQRRAHTRYRHHRPIVPAARIALPANIREPASI
jgi:hypothetical protein